MMNHAQRIASRFGWKKFSTRKEARVVKGKFFLVACLIASLLAASCERQSGTHQAEYRPAPSSTKSEANAPAQYAANARAGLAKEKQQRDDEGNGNTEAYSHIEENPFLEVAHAPLSTFSIDVDTASYSNARRFLLDEKRLPPKDAVRIEEFVNYFTYDYPQPAADVPFSVTTEVSECPWNNAHRLVQIGLQGRKIPLENLPPANLVFLLDVSGSMNEENKLPLVKTALRTLTEQLRPRDRVAIVVYAGNSGMVLPSTSGDRKSEIIAALDRLDAGGSTNGGAGIELAYKIALDNFIQGGSNRVILATDGDFNVGTTSEGDLVRLIEEKRKSGVFLSVLGFGTGNVKDATMEKLADKGNGNYAYIDTQSEARKALGAQLGGTLFTIAKDVKLQIEFNPKQAAAYRLIGYENRLLRDEDFNDDKKDAGDIGSGHTVTALYEIVPFGQKFDNAGVDPLKYQQRATPNAMANSSELMTIKLRYKQPDADESKLLSIGVADSRASLSNASENLKFASAVAEFGMLLRESKYKGDATYADVLQRAKAATGNDLQGYRSEFVKLVESARSLSEHRASIND
jgi:Ca-activated chloride channel family protein